MKRISALIAILLCMAAVACRGDRPPAGADADLAACLPPDSLAVAGVDLDRLRAWPLYAKLPPAAAAFLQPLGSASSVLAAYNGKEALLVARGRFREAPELMTLLGNGLAAAGSPEAVSAAAAQRRTGKGGAGWLMEQAAAVSSSPVWLVARGGVTLPLSGEAANLNQLIRLVDYAAVGVRLDSELRFDAVARGVDERSAQRFEENLRALFTLAAVAQARNAPLAKSMRAAQVGRDGLTVRVALSMEPTQLESVLPGKQP